MDASYNSFYRSEINPNSTFIDDITKFLEAKVDDQFASFKADFFNKYKEEDKTEARKYEIKKTKNLIENYHKLLQGQQVPIDRSLKQIYLQDRIAGKDELANHPMFKRKLRTLKLDFMHRFCEYAFRALTLESENFYLCNQYIIDVDSKVRRAIEESEYFKKVVELLSYYRYLKWLKKEALSLVAETDIAPQPNGQTKPKRKTDLEYDKLFREPDKAIRLLEILKRENIIVEKDGNWHWQTAVTDIPVLTRKLIEAKLLHIPYRLTVGRILSKKFGFDGIPCDKTLFNRSKEKNNQDVNDEFDHIVSLL